MMELKPCPFCGSEAEVSEYGPLIEGEPRMVIWCASRYCPLNDVGGNNFDTKEAAIKAWNTRAGETVECPGCEENCLMPVETIKFISCDKRDDVGRVRLSTSASTPPR